MSKLKKLETGITDSEGRVIVKIIDDMSTQYYVEFDCGKLDFVFKKDVKRI